MKVRAPGPVVMSVVVQALGGAPGPFTFAAAVTGLGGTRPEAGGGGGAAGGGSSCSRKERLRLGGSGARPSRARPAAPSRLAAQLWGLPGGLDRVLHHQV